MPLVDLGLFGHMYRMGRRAVWDFISRGVTKARNQGCSVVCAILNRRRKISKIVLWKNTVLILLVKAHLTLTKGCWVKSESVFVGTGHAHWSSHETIFLASKENKTVTRGRRKKSLQPFFCRNFTKSSSQLVLKLLYALVKLSFPSYHFSYNNSELCIARQCWYISNKLRFRPRFTARQEEKIDFAAIFLDI